MQQQQQQLVKPQKTAQQKKNDLLKMKQNMLIDLKMRMLLNKQKSPQPNHQSTPPQPVVKRDSADTIPDMPSPPSNNPSVSSDEGCDSPSNFEPVVTPSRTAAATVDVCLAPGVFRSMTYPEYEAWRKWPFIDRVVIDVSSDEEDESDEDVESKSCTSNQLQRKKSREEQIEDMKIRLVLLGKCPSVLQQLAKSPTLKAPKAAPSSKRPCSASRDGLETEVKDAPISKQTSATNAENVDSPAGSVEQSTPKAKVISNTTVPRPPDLPLSEALPETAALKTTEVGSFAKKSAEMTTLTVSPVTPSQKIARDPPLRKQHSVSSGSISLPLESRIKKPSQSRNATSPGKSRQIEELKRKIAALEERRQILSNARIQTSLSSAFGPSVPKPVESTRGKQSNPKVDDVVTGSNGGSTRYYMEPASRVSQEKGKTAKVVDKKSAEDSSPSPVPSPKIEHPDTQGPWNKRPTPKDDKDKVTSAGVDASYIRDLEMELERRTKELDSERDRANQVQTADVAVAEAFAKLQYKRSRVKTLEEELSKTREEADEAQKEYDKLRCVAKQLRSFDVQMEDSEEPESIVEEPISLVDSGNYISGKYSDPINSRRQNYASTDPILRSSPFSRSTEDYYQSCLTGFRSYAPRMSCPIGPKACAIQTSRFALRGLTDVSFLFFFMLHRAIFHIPQVFVALPLLF